MPAEAVALFATSKIINGHRLVLEHPNLPAETRRWILTYMLDDVWPKFPPGTYTADDLALLAQHHSQIVRTLAALEPAVSEPTLVRLTGDASLDVAFVAKAVLLVRNPATEESRRIRIVDRLASVRDKALATAQSW